MKISSVLPTTGDFKPERPRERLLQHGAHALTTAELLAIVLRTGTKGRSAVCFAHDLLNHFGGLQALLCADSTDLLKMNGLGLAKVCELVAINELSKRALEEDLKHGVVLNQPDKVRRFCMAHLGHLTIEHCMVLFLDSQYRLITSEEVSKGTLTQASVYPREIVKACLRYHAAAMIMVHNHPSGVAEPSNADLQLTIHLKKALALVDIKLLDHLIVTSNRAISLAELGKL